MNELFPIVAGLLCGLVLGSLTAKRRIFVGVAFAVVAGLLATIISGEWRISWAFLLIDIPLVAISSVAGVLLSRKVVLQRATRCSSLSGRPAADARHGGAPGVAYSGRVIRASARLHAHFTVVAGEGWGCSLSWFVLTAATKARWPGLTS